MSQYRNVVADGVLNDITASIAATIDVYFMIELIAADERRSDHQYSVRYEGVAINDGETEFMDLLNFVGSEGSFDSTRWSFISSSKGDTTTNDGLHTFILTLLYAKKPTREPIAGARNVQVGRYETQKKTLFASMHDYCVKKMLEEKDVNDEPANVCSICLDQPDLPPRSYYLCENLHLMCKPCKDGWRGGENKNWCPVCHNVTQYKFVITPPASQQDEF